MAEKGFDGVSVREICAHAGTSCNMVPTTSTASKVCSTQSSTSSAPVSSLCRCASWTNNHNPKEEFLSIIELLFETTLEAYIEHRSLMLVVVREQANPQPLPAYMERLAAFLEKAKSKRPVEASPLHCLGSECLRDSLQNVA